MVRPGIIRPGVIRLVRDRGPGPKCCESWAGKKAAPEESRVNSRLGPVSELTPPRGRRFSGRAEPRLQPRRIGGQATSESFILRCGQARHNQARYNQARCNQACQRSRPGPKCCESWAGKKAAPEESRVNSRLGPVSELTPPWRTPLQRQSRAAASAATHRGPGHVRPLSSSPIATRRDHSDRTPGGPRSSLQLPPPGGGLAGLADIVVLPRCCGGSTSGSSTLSPSADDGLR